MQFLWIILFVSLFQDGQTSVCNTCLRDNARGQEYKYGDTVHFSCQVLNATVIDRSQFFLWNVKNGMKIPITDIKEHTGYIDVKVVSKETGGTYSCRYGNCCNDTLCSAMAIKIDECSFPSEEDTRAPPMNCIVNDLDNMTCDWTVHNNNNCTIWQAMYKSEEMESYQCCTAGGNCTSTKAQCSIPYDDFYRYIHYNISLMQISEHGTFVHNYTVVPDDNIVRIDMNDVVHVEQGDDPYTLVVGFTLHHPPSAVGGMTCNVSYKSEWDGGDDTVTSTHNMTQSTLDVNISLGGLTPFTNYTVNILCKPQTSPYWSSSVSGTGRTGPVVPDSVPDLIGYSDTRTDTVGQRNIYLYLKPLQRRHWYGKHTGYLVSVDIQEDQVFSAVDSQVFSANTVTGQLNGTFSTNQSYVITIHTVNEAGVADQSVGMNVPVSDEEDKSPVTVVAEEAHNGSQVILFPGREDAITSVTYYFCQGEPKLYPPICKTELQNVTVSGFKNTSSSSKLNYISYYGVSINSSDTFAGNRIVWSKCIFSQNGRVSVNELDVSASVLPSNSSVVTVYLHFGYCQLRQRPLSYLVGFWKTYRNFSNYCKNNLAELQTFTATPSTRELQVYVGSALDVTLCLRVQYRGQFDISEDFIPSFSSISKSVVSTSGKKMEKGKIITIAVICSVTFSLLLVAFLFCSRKRIIEMVNRNKVSDEIIASILKDCPEDMPTQTSDESSGVFSISTSSTDVWKHNVTDQSGRKSIDDNQASSSGFNEMSRLESDLPVQTEDESRNIVDNYLEPVVNLRNDLGWTSGSSCADYQLVAGQSFSEPYISPDDGYLVAVGHVPDDPVGDIIGENMTVRNVVENVSDRELTSGTGDDTGNLSAGDYRRAGFLTHVNSASLSSDEYLVVNMQTVSSSVGIPSGWQSFEPESPNLQFSHSTNERHWNSSSSFFQEYSACDEYMRGLEEIGTNVCSRQAEDVRTVASESSNNFSNFLNGARMRFLNSDSFVTDGHDRTDGFQAFTTCGHEGHTSGDSSTVTSDIHSTDECQQTDSWGSYSELDSDVITAMDTESSTPGVNRNEVFDEPAVVTSNFNAIHLLETDKTTDFHTNIPPRQIERKGVEMKEISLTDSAIQNPVNKRERNDFTVEMRNSQLISPEDMKKALENIGHVFENDIEYAQEYLVDSYAMANTQTSDCNLIDSDADLEGYVTSSSQ